MNDPNRELIDDFIHGRGTFSDVAIQNYVDPEDLKSAKYHLAAGNANLALAKTEESPNDWKRLMKTVEWHFARVDQILKRYEC
jgi:hypothetical protein